MSKIDTLLQQITELYLLAYASLSKLTWPVVETEILSSFLVDVIFVCKLGLPVVLKFLIFLKF